MKPSCNKRIFAILVLALWTGTVRSARAQAAEQATAQALFDEAKQLLADGRAADACPKFEESQRLDPGSGTLLNLAKCYEQTGRLASAWSTYLEAASSAKAAGNTERERVARELAAGVAPRLSKLVIAVGPEPQRVPGLEITRDGVVVRPAQWGLALPADPGEHEVVAKAPGHAPWQTKIQVTGEATTETVTVPELAVQAEEPKPGDSAQTQLDTNSKPRTGLGAARIAALAAGGVGVVGVGVGTYFGLQAKSKQEEATKYCNGSACTDQRGVDAGTEARTAGNVSTVMMIVGGVGLAAGVTLWLTAPKPEAAKTARISLAPGSVHLTGAW